MAYTVSATKLQNLKLIFTDIFEFSKNFIWSHLKHINSKYKSVYKWLLMWILKMWEVFQTNYIWVIFKKTKIYP